MDTPEENPDPFELRRRQLESLGAALRRQMQNWSKMLEPYQALARAISPAVLEFGRQWSELSSKIGEAVKNLPPTYRRALEMLAERGWYFDEEMALSMPAQLIRIYDRPGGEEEAEAMLVQHFAQRLDSIEESICQRFPRREKIVRAAFGAHRAGQYELSIPPILAQVDGMCVDALGAEFFQRLRNDPRPRTAAYASSPEHNEWDAAWLSPLNSIGQVGKGKSERGMDFVGLNRHQVMHGESVDYGNEINSLKAISLLNYVAQVLPDVKWMKPTDVTTTKT
ncbi:hypothetical protein [Cupriavidus sp. DL-D2]|uniref:hypothetical protein n=1 Tax=Cupriavidus sp. DL-D2 TaxID=3144974 RepID=UPI003215E11A